MEHVYIKPRTPRPLGLLLMATSFLVGGYMMQDRRRLGWFSTVGATVLMVMPLAAVATITLPNVFTNGSVADADGDRKNKRAFPHRRY